MHAESVFSTGPRTRQSVAMHPRLQARGPWRDHCGELPLIHRTLIRLKVEHLPGDRDPKPVWLWSSRTGLSAADIDLRWQAFLRRFDLEHTFRLFKQTLGWTVPKTPRRTGTSCSCTTVSRTAPATSAGSPTLRPSARCSKVRADCSWSA